METVKLNSIILSTVVCMLINIEITLAQRVGIDTIQPEATLHVGGEDGLLVTGEFGAGENLLNSGSGTKMFFYPKKSAFRSGFVNGNQWDDAQIGDYSFAWGQNTIATGSRSTAWGFNNQASGTRSTSWGENTISSAVASTAFGINTEASGFSSTAWGSYTKAKSTFETALGRYNTDYIPISTSNFGWNTTDRLFVIGNGTSDSNRSDAMVILKNGKTGIGYSNPEATLHVADGLLVTGEFGAGEDLLSSGAGTKLFFYPKKAAFRAGRVLLNQWDDAQIGEYSSAWGINTLASAYSSTVWGTSNNATGTGSTAWGTGTLASEFYATAWGQSSVASGARSTAWGNSTASGQSSTAWGNTIASGDFSTAWGNSTEASGILSTSWGENTSAIDFYATAWGQDTQAYGVGSTTWGTNTISQSGYETALGRWNTNYNPNSTTGWNANDRLFGIGNGSSSTNRSDALVVLKNGNTGIGISNPQHKLAVEVTTNTTPNGDGVGIVNTNNNNFWNIHMSQTFLRFSYNNATATAYIESDGTYVQPSDRRLKENIQPLQDGVLQKINSINTVHYNYINDKEKNTTTGVIAQELKEIFPEFVHQDNSDDFMGVNYAGLSVIAIKAIQEQQKEIEVQFELIESLKAKNKMLEDKIEYILKQIE